MELKELKEKAFINTFPYFPLFLKEVEGKFEGDFFYSNGKKVPLEKATFRNTKREFFLYFFLSNAGILIFLFFYSFFSLLSKAFSYEAYFPFSFSWEVFLSPLAFLGFLLLFNGILTLNRVFPVYLFLGVFFFFLLFFFRESFYLFADCLFSFFYSLILRGYLIKKDVKGEEVKGFYLFKKEKENGRT